MNRLIPLKFVISSVVLFCASDVFAGTFAGRALTLPDPQRQNQRDPIENALVEVIALSGSNAGNVISRTNTKANGTWRVTIPDGLTVRIQFTKPGQQSANLIGLSSDSQVTSLDVVMPKSRSSSYRHRCRILRWRR